MGCLLASHSRIERGLSHYRVVVSWTRAARAVVRQRDGWNRDCSVVGALEVRDGDGGLRLESFIPVSLVATQYLRSCGLVESHTVPAAKGPGTATTGVTAASSVNRSRLQATSQWGFRIPAGRFQGTRLGHLKSSSSIQQWFVHPLQRIGSQGSKMATSTAGKLKPLRFVRTVCLMPLDLTECNKEVQVPS
jgi:hypothetical protein